MAADGAADDAVGAGEDVDVEVGVDLQGGEDHEVQLVHGGGHHVAGVVAGADLVVEVVVFQALGGVQVEALHVQDAVDEALLVHGGDLAGDAAQGEAAVDVLVDHLLAQEPGGGQDAPPEPICMEKPSYR